MAWKLVEVDDSDQTALTDAELVAISVYLAKESKQNPKYNCFTRAWLKIQPEVNRILRNP